MTSRLLNPYLDPKRPLIKTGHHLPHWHQDNKLQFVTFRLADSLPQYVLNQLKKQREEFIKTNPLPWDKDTKELYNGILTESEQNFLDQGYGSCLFREKIYRDLLIKSIEYHNGTRYCIESYVIMPNHVHILLTVNAPYTLDQIIGSIKRYSAISINKARGKTGEKLWSENYWDTIIRNYRHREKVINYIQQNPSFLPESDYTLFPS